METERKACAFPALSHGPARQGGARHLFGEGAPAVGSGLLGRFGGVKK